jgi:membrane protein
MQLPPRVKSIWEVLQGTVSNWLSDQASSISAALAFYCAFSLAPLLIILVTIAGWIVGSELAYGYVSSQLTALFGKASANVLLQAMRNSQTGEGWIASALSVGTLILGATTVFAALDTALAQVWGRRLNAPGGWWGFVRTRVISFGFILAIGFILLVSLTLTTALAALRGWVLHRYPDLVLLVTLVDFTISIGLGTGMVALIYRYMPAHRLSWQHVAYGAFVTALLFYLGRWAIGLYLGRSTQPSAFGAAASFAALLLWLYYSAQIFLFGAEFTATLSGTRKAPSER